MLNLNDVYEFVYENLIDVTTSKGGLHFHARCPLCGDSEISESKKRFHLEYSYDNAKYHCFNCDRAGDFYKLYGEIKGIESKEAWKKYHKYNPDEIKNKWKTKSEKKEKTILKTSNLNWIKKESLSIKDTPNGYIQEKYYKILKQFVEDRNIKLEVFICYTGRYKDRIIIPIYDQNDIIFFQGRTIHDNVSTKYLNPAVDKQNIIFNKDNFIKNETIFITEGLLDAQSISNNATCCLGKSITDEFLELIYEYTDKIIIIFDNDKDGIISLKNMIKTSKYKNYLKYFVMPSEFNDIKDINKLVTVHSDVDIVEFIKKNSYPMWKIKLKLGKK